MSRLQLLCISLLGLLLLLSFSANPPQGRTGGPGEATCATIGCHNGSTIAFDGHLEIRGLPKTIERETTYTLNLDLIVDRGSPARGGFQMMVLSNTEMDVGGFSSPGESSTISSSGGRTYFEHDPAKNFEDADTLSYNVDFEVGSQVEGQEIIIYAAANFANGSGSSGDKIVTFSDTLHLGCLSDSLILAIETTSPSCPESDDGQVKITPMCGQPPYTFFFEQLVDMSDSCITFSNLSSGDYNVTVIDAAQQESFGSVSIINPETDTSPPIISCVADTFVISSCSPFTYPIPSAMDNCGSTGVELISGKGPNNSFEPGIHLEIYEVIDEFGNTAVCTIFVQNNVFLDVVLGINNLNCVEDSLGSLDFIIDGDNPPFTTRHIDNRSLDSLPKGEHTIIISDQTGCSIERSFVIQSADSLSLQISNITQPLNATSGDGAIDIEVEGGVKPYSYIWRTEDEIFSNEEDLSLLFPGEYIVEVVDNNACSVISDTIRLDAITSTYDVSISNSIMVYPNPTNDWISIQSDYLERIKHIEFFDRSGRKIRSQFTRFENILTGDIPPGVISIIVTLKDGRKGQTRFIKIE